MMYFFLRCLKSSTSAQSQTFIMFKPLILKDAFYYRLWCCHLLITSNYLPLFDELRTKTFMVLHSHQRLCFSNLEKFALPDSSSRFSFPSFCFCWKGSEVKRLHVFTPLITQHLATILRSFNPEWGWPAENTLTLKSDMYQEGLSVVMEKTMSFWSLTSYL